GRIKQTWLARLLDLRQRQPDLFLRGSYVPVEVKGAHARHVIAFLRCHQDQRLLLVVPRCPWRLLGRRSLPCIAAHRWQDTVIVLPDNMKAEHFVALGSGNTVSSGNGTLSLSRCLDGVPVDVLIPSDTAADRY
ncbi:MAG TPA: hypothetical protein VFJ01_01475, partial [Oleiagrimonas sp.]|nr:hypothetical protein [Oleiagrimonas sp.]